MWSQEAVRPGRQFRWLDACPGHSRAAADTEATTSLAFSRGRGKVRLAVHALFAGVDTGSVSCSVGVLRRRRPSCQDQPLPAGLPGSGQRWRWDWVPGRRPPARLPRPARPGTAWRHVRAAGTGRPTPATGSTGHTATFPGHKRIFRYPTERGQ